MALIDDVKQSLRLSTTAYDTEVSDLIDECKADLKLSGVLEAAIVDTDPMIKRAIKTYTKANFGFDNPDAEKLLESYKMLKIHLCLSTDYTEAVV